MQVSITVHTQYFISCDEIYEKYGNENGGRIKISMYNKHLKMNMEKVRYINRKFGHSVKQTTTGFLCADKEAVRELLTATKDVV